MPLPMPADCPPGLMRQYAKKDAWPETDQAQGKGKGKGNMPTGRRLATISGLQHA